MQRVLTEVTPNTNADPALLVASIQEKFIVHEHVVIRLGTDTMDMTEATHTHAVIMKVPDCIEILMNKTMERVPIISHTAFIQIKEAYTLMYKGASMCARIHNMRVTYLPKPRKPPHRPPRPPGVSVHEILDHETLVVVCPASSKFTHFANTEHVPHVDISESERAYFVQRYNAYKYVDENGVKSIIDVFD